MLKLAALAALTLGVAIPAVASAQSGDHCPARTGTVATDRLGNVWHKGGSLYACTVVYGTKPRAVRVGRWAPQTRVDFDGVTVVWTTPLTRDGVRSDRVSAADVQAGRRWMTSRRLLPAGDGTPSREARIQRVIAAFAGVGWVTRSGDVVLALQQPVDAPVAVGALPAPPVARDDLTLVGTWTPPAGVTSAKALADTARIDIGDGEGDECGGTDPYTMTVVPDAAAPAVGVTWPGAWERGDCG